MSRDTAINPLSTAAFQRRLAACNVIVKRHNSMAWCTMTLWADSVYAATYFYSDPNNGGKDLRVEAKTMSDAICALEDAIARIERCRDKVAETLGITMGDAT